MSDSITDASESPFKRKRILVVDDEPNIVRLIQVNLERSGYEVETAGSGTEAFGKIVANPPDLLVTDAHMPEMDGIELTAKIRGNAALAVLPVILMPSKAADREYPDIPYFKSLGFSHIVIKPFAPKELLSKVNKILSVPDDSRETG